MPPVPPTDALTQFRAQDLDAAMADVNRKQDVVTPMFDVIAPRYDAFTRLFSFGMDAPWKAALIDAVAAHATRAREGVDLACGTGDLAMALAHRIPGLSMLGVDPSGVMLDQARARISKAESSAAMRDRLTFWQGDMASLPCRDGSVDVLTAGYGFRNVPDVAAAVRECARVLRPGGVLGSLDFFLPPTPAWRALFLGYLRVAGDVVGWWWHRTPAIYGYISRSIARFMTADAFAAMLTAHGFELVHQRHHLFGGIGMHVAVKRS
jgi:demethylmenaquinone methyltransferase / 2-methoxy-6-polyprenyl-1,4-benzoquinol methylase